MNDHAFHILEGSRLDQLIKRGSQFNTAVDHVHRPDGEERVLFFIQAGQFGIEKNISNFPQGALRVGSVQLGAGRSVFFFFFLRNPIAAGLSSAGVTRPGLSGTV